MSLTINTNLSSLIVQSSLTQSTNGLNQAIERMTTGFKINGAKDNAAGYSINTNMTTKIGAYQVAEDNASMGLNLLMTASDSLSLITSHLSRIRDLAEQASNGTYGDDSLSAIQSEVNARMSEISRIISTTEYNGIKLFDQVKSSGSTGSFIEEVTPLTEEEAIAQGYTVIKTADELQAMKDNLNGKYILMNDIDLSDYNWQVVGSETNPFTGELNGNGHVISNLTINKPAEDYQGLFGMVMNGTLENIALENVDVTGAVGVGALAGGIQGDIINSYSTGSVNSNNGYVGGLAGAVLGNIKNSYSTSSVKGSVYVGGLIGALGSGNIANSYTSGSVTGNEVVGGLVGYLSGGSCTSSYSTKRVSGSKSVGGFIGYVDNGSVDNCYSSGNVAGNTEIGGFIGSNNAGVFTSCYYDTQKSGSSIGVGSGNGSGVSGVTPSELYNLILAGKLPKFTTGGIKSNGVSDMTLQIGIDSSDSSKLTFNTGLTCTFDIDLTSQAGARTALEAIDNILSQVNSKQTELGSAQNRLESVLESISVQYENLVSSRSTLRDADISEESSNYIRYQILQQASATLLATANQTPSIALQLL